MIELVRKQLLKTEEEDRIFEAIRAKIDGKALTGNMYFTWMSYSGLNFKEPTAALLSLVNRRVIHRSLFDIQLGQTVKSVILNRYTEVRDARLTIEEFLCNEAKFVSASALFEIWWDRLGLLETNYTSWAPWEVKNEPKFATLVEVWLEDSDSVQRCLDFFESTKIFTNNPLGLSHPVISEKNALKLIGFAKVRCLNNPIHVDHLLTPLFRSKLMCWIGGDGRTFNTCRPSSRSRASWLACFMQELPGSLSFSFMISIPGNLKRRQDRDTLAPFLAAALKHTLNLAFDWNQSVESRTFGTTT